MRNLLVLRTLGIGALAFCCGCSTKQDMSRYVKDGVAYGVVDSFRGRFWNYYERGGSFLEGEFYEEAERDLKVAIADRGEDQRWARTYGLHLIPEYFPNRELGIVHYYQGRTDEAIRRLDASYRQQPSGRASYFLGLARLQRITQLGLDEESPTIEILEPASASAVGAINTRLVAVARDDTYVARITIDGEEYPVLVSEDEINIDRELVLAPGINEINITVEDITGNVTNLIYRIESDVDGPIISFDEPVNARQTISGVVFDAAGVESLVVSGVPAQLTEGTNGLFDFALNLDESDIELPLRYEASDSFGNVTRGTLGAEPLVSARVQQEIVRAVDRTLPAIATLRTGDPIAPDGAYDTLLRQTETAWDLQPQDFESYRVAARGFSPAGSPALIRVAVAARPRRNPRAAPPRAVTRGGANPTMRIARQQDDAPTVRFLNLADGEEYSQQEIVVAMRVDSQDPIREVKLNGFRVDTIPGRNVQQLSRVIKLENEGTHTIRASVVDEAGRRGEYEIAIERVPNEIESQGKLSVLVLGHVPASTGRPLSQEASQVTELLVSGEAQIRKRFTLVNRSEMTQILGEQQLSAALGDKDARLELGRIVPAEVGFIGKVNEHNDSTIDISLTAISIETSVEIARVDVTGAADKNDPSARADEFNRLVRLLDRYIVQKFPLVEGRIRADSDGPKFQCDINKETRVLDYTKVIVYRRGDPILAFDDVTVIDYELDLLGEAFLISVRNRSSVGEIVKNLVEGEGDLSLLRGDYGVTK